MFAISQESWHYGQSGLFQGAQAIYPNLQAPSLLQSDCLCLASIRLFVPMNTALTKLSELLEQFVWVSTFC